MEKLGVDTNTDNPVKTGSEQDVCPVCSSKVEILGQVKKCPQCGTRPYEAPL